MRIRFNRRVGIYGDERYTGCGATIHRDPALGPRWIVDSETLPEPGAFHVGTWERTFGTLRAAKRAVSAACRR